MNANNESHQRVVVALGGNAIAPSGGEYTAEEQTANMALAAKSVADLISAGYEPLITHGNGPQVGNLLLKNELSANVVPAMPLDWGVAQTQATIGFTLVTEIELELQRRAISRAVASIITRVEVNPNDPSFKSPAKPIGRPRSDGTHRLVSSPSPLEILDLSVIESLLGLGVVVVACGGGGIPMVKKAGTVTGVEAVIDKDLCTALLAERTGARRMVIVTDVEGIKTNFGTKEEKIVKNIRSDELRTLLEKGQFPAGSMAPKVQAVLQFVDATGGTAAIGALTHLTDVVNGRAGTQITS